MARPSLQLPLRSRSPRNATTLPAITLSGITDGLGDTGQILSVTATSSNSALIPNPASASATISAGTVTSIGVNSGGTGYAFAPAVTISGGGGTGATATAILGTGSNASAVTSITVTGGSGYTSAASGHDRPADGHGRRRHGSRSAPPRTAGTVTSITTNGMVTAITPTNGGSGYSSTNLPNVTIAPPVSGTQATAIAIVVGGQVVGLNFTNLGSGLLEPRVHRRSPSTPRSSPARGPPPRPRSARAAPAI